MGEQLTVCLCSCPFPVGRPSAGCTHPSLGPCLPGCIYLETLGKESCSHHYLCPTECKPSKTCTCRVTDQWGGETLNKIAALSSESVWVLTCSLIKIPWSKSCCLCRGDDSFFTTFCSLPSFLVASCLKKNQKKSVVVVSCLHSFEACDVEEKVSNWKENTLLTHAVSQHGYPWNSVYADDVQ